MGSPANEKGRSENEGPQHRVTIAKPFAVGKYEVTFAEWHACVSVGGCTQVPEGWGDKRPVMNMPWDFAKKYVAWLSKRTGKTYRLLSEFEWEYAARAGTTTRYAFGDTITKQQARFSSDDPDNVGSFKPNAFGLYDMHGSMREWVEDVWHDTYNGAPADGSAWLQGGDVNRHVLRSGFFHDDPLSLRSAWRWGQGSGLVFPDGFRVGRTLTP